MSQQYPVNNVDDAYNVCYPDESLGPDDARYVDLTPVRGGKSLATIIGRRIRRTRPPHFHQQLVSGHRGSGKSTELRRLQRNLHQDKLFAVYLDVEDLLDLGEIRYQDVLVAIAQSLERDLRAESIVLNLKLIEELRTWFAAQLKAPECHLVYTVPISLAFRASLGNTFSDAPFLLPMVDFTSEPGRDCLREVIRHRIDVAQVFDAEATVDRLIEISGGAVRDLMRLVRMACDDALDSITARDAEAAIRSLTNEFDRLLKDEDIALLSEIARARIVSYNDASARLLELRLVHEFQNLQEERWADLHPALRRTKRMQAALQGGTP